MCVIGCWFVVLASLGVLFLRAEETSKLSQRSRLPRRGLLRAAAAQDQPGHDHPVVPSAMPPSSKSSSTCTWLPRDMLTIAMEISSKERERERETERETERERTHNTHTQIPKKFVSSCRAVACLVEHEQRTSRAIAVPDDATDDCAVASSSGAKRFETAAVLPATVMDRFTRRHECDATCKFNARR